MANCPYCGELHSQLYVCDEHVEARKKAERAEAAGLPHLPVSRPEDMMVKEPKSRTYRYRDPEKRRAYMRKLMRKRRSEKAGKED